MNGNALSDRVKNMIKVDKSKLAESSSLVINKKSNPEDTKKSSFQKKTDGTPKN